MISSTLDTLTGSSTATNANWIVSLEDVYEREKVDLSATANISAFYSNCISRASDRIESYYDSPVKVQEYLANYDCEYSNQIYLNKLPIVAVSSLKHRSATYSNWTDVITLGSMSNYLLIYPFKLVISNHTFYTGYQSVQVQYSAGFSIIPDDIKQVALEMIAIMIRESRQGNSNAHLGIQSVNDGGATNKNVTYLELTDRWKEMLLPHKLKI
jgi:hypothetical protein